MTIKRGIKTAAKLLLSVIAFLFFFALTAVFLPCILLEHIRR